AANDRDFAQLFQKLLKRWEAVIVLTFTKARKLMRIDINIEEAAFFIVASIEGSFGYAKVYHSKKRFVALMNQLHEYIQSLVRD
ncbi:MAG: hypothetical protein OEW60_08125, partial [Thiovulaceae bacterium]|nr:hypothetical protein [Sulfurimonadaceae bacterium]